MTEEVQEEHQIEGKENEFKKNVTSLKKDLIFWFFGVALIFVGVVFLIFMYGPLPLPFATVLAILTIFFGWWGATKVRGGFMGTINCIKDFVPFISSYYKQKEIKYKQSGFSKTLRNAIDWYGIKIDSVSDDYLQRFESVNNSEKEWLHEASDALSKKLDLTPEIITLAFYDYTGNQQGLRNAWTKIKHDNSQLRALVKVATEGRLAMVEHLDRGPNKSYGAIEELMKKLDPFTLQEFEPLFYSFYTDLARTKESLLEALNAYRFSVGPATRERIYVFVPSTTRQEKWPDELIEHASKELHESPEVISLIFAERTGNHIRRKQLWEMIRKDETTIRHIIQVLVDNGLLTVPTHYKKSRESYLRVLADKIAVLGDFSMEEVQREFYSLFGELDQTKQALLYVLGRFKMPLSETERIEFFSLFPESKNFLNEFSEYINGALGVENEIVLLLYFNHVQEDRKERFYFEKIKQVGLLNKLALLIIENQVIRVPIEGQKEEDVTNLATIIQSQDKFNLTEIQSMFLIYSRLLGYANNLSDFLYSEEMIKRKVNLTFSDLLSLVKGVSPDSIYEQLKAVCSHILTLNFNVKIKITDDVIKPVIVSSLALYFTERGDVNAPETCKEAAIVKKASRILYQYISEGEKETRREAGHFSLKLITEGVLKDRFKEEDYKHINEFKSELSHGYLSPSIRALLTARLQAIEESIRAKKELERMLQDITTAVDDFLEVELKEDFIIDSLNTQLLSAYMITKRTQLPIMDIIDNYLPEVYDQVRRSDPSFSGILMLAEDKSATGKVTRMGVVPFGMSFEDFSEKFSTIFQKAVNKYRENNPDTPSPEEFSLHIARIFPSELAFRVVSGSAVRAPGIPPDHPVNTVKRLMMKYYPPLQNLKLIASLDTEKERTVAMKSVLVNLINRHATIYLMTKKQILSIVAGRARLLEKIESGEFDIELLARYGCGSLSELSEHIHKTCMLSSKDERATFSKLRNELVGIVKSYKSRIGDDELRTFSSAVFNTLRNVGSILFRP